MAYPKSPTGPLTQERLRSVVFYDPDTGIFTRLIGAPNIKAGSACGSLMSNGYLLFTIDSRPYLAHRLAFLYMEGSLPAGHVDHKNGNRVDNRWSNLRHATALINAQNIRASKGARSLPLGVFQAKNTTRFFAQLRSGKKSIYLGTFDTPAEAHQKYLAAKRVHHEGNTL